VWPACADSGMEASARRRMLCSLKVFISRGFLSKGRAPKKPVKWAWIGSRELARAQEMPICTLRRARVYRSRASPMVRGARSPRARTPR
jgi:hypothetical protein